MHYLLRRFSYDLRKSHKRKLINIMVIMFDSPYLWKLRDDKELESLKYDFDPKTVSCHGLEEKSSMTF